MLRAVFERFTEHARQVIVLAQEQSRTLKHEYVGTEHILLGLLAEKKGLAARVLNGLDISLEQARAQVERIVGTGEEVRSGHISFTPRAKEVFELSLREAQSLGHLYIGTEHLLLGLVRENGGVGARVLLDLDADSEKVRKEVLQVLNTGPRRSYGHHQERLEPDLSLPIQVGVAARVRRVVMLAASRALASNRTQIGLHDLLWALTADESIAPLLADLGIDERAMTDAIKRQAEREQHPESPDD